MRALALLIAASCALACASHAPDSLSVDSPDAEPGQLEPLVHRPSAVPEPELLECLPEGFTPRPPTPPEVHKQPERGPCWTIPAALRESLEREAKHDWHLINEGGTLDVAFACDRLGDIEELVYEAGSGHGGGLQLARLRRDANGGDWDVLMIRRELGIRSGGPDTFAPRVWRGRLADAQVRDALLTARAAVSMQLEERAPKQAGEHLGWFSSADVYDFVRVTDADRIARERSFVGYLSSGAQSESIPTTGATSAIAKLLDDAGLSEGPVDADSRVFFMERYLDSEARMFADEFGWWVRERMVELASEHASADLIPALARQLCLDNDGSSDGRTRAEALASILALGGHEAALETDASEQVSDALTARWLDACEVACGR